MKKIVKMPSCANTNFSEGLEGLLSFYSSLGWDKDFHELDPRKVVINPSDAHELLQLFTESASSADERVGFSMLWLNYGPSSSEEVRNGHVLLKDGWLIESPKEEKVHESC